MQLCKHLKR